MYEGHIRSLYFDESNSMGKKNNLFKNDVGKIGYPLKNEI